MPLRGCCSGGASAPKGLSKGWVQWNPCESTSAQKCGGCEPVGNLSPFREAGSEQRVGSINTLTAKKPSGVNTMISDEDWVEIEVAVDSGATETVMSEETLSGVIDITEGPAMKRGVAYEVADGTEIPNLGETKFLGFTEEGGAQGVTAQVCAVNKTLMSVSKIAAKGNRVVFDDDGSYIEDKATGERTWMRQVGGMYHIKMWGLPQKHC